MHMHMHKCIRLAVHMQYTQCIFLDLVTPFYRRLRGPPARPFRGERLAHTRARIRHTARGQVCTHSACPVVWVAGCLLLGRELLLQQLGGRGQRGGLLLPRVPRGLRLARRRLLLHGHCARQLRGDLVARLELPRVRVGLHRHLPLELVHLVLQPRAHADVDRRLVLHAGDLLAHIRDPESVFYFDTAVRLAKEVLHACVPVLLQLARWSGVRNCTLYHCASR